MFKLSYSVIAVSLILSGCETPNTPAVSESINADTIYTNGKIYTVNADQPWVDAVAIRAGKFVAVGSVAMLMI